MKKYTFTKEERLCRKVLIERLFHEGSSFILYPYRIVFHAYPASDWGQNPFGKPAAQVIISVPKKRFKHAVDRNLIKRRTREAYRVHKNQILYPEILQKKLFLTFAIQYIGKTIEPYSFMLQRMESVLKRFVDQMQVDSQKEIDNVVDRRNS